VADTGRDVNPQFLKAPYVSERLAKDGREHLERSLGRMMVLALLAGGFVTLGALFSVVIGAGITAEGPSRLVEGFGFSAGYYFVALASVALFTEANIALPDVLLDKEKPHRHLLRFWITTFVFNFLAAFVVGWMVHLAQDYSAEVQSTLSEIVDGKMAYRERGGVGAWGSIVLSGALANWLVGLAFFFATMAQSVLGKYLPLALAVMLFEAANFQHSPANMAYFSLIMPSGDGPGWWNAIAWNIVPAAIGNIIGGALLAAVPFWYVFRGGARTGDDSG
jgi:formate/nitrite transporter FocA (FNT family)